MLIAEIMRKISLLQASREIIETDKFKYSDMFYIIKNKFPFLKFYGRYNNIWKNSIVNEAL